MAVSCWSGRARCCCAVAGSPRSSAMRASVAQVMSWKAGSPQVLAQSQQRPQVGLARAGAGEHVRVRAPYKGRDKPASQKTANSAHAKLRSPGERANAQLKTWSIMRKLRCCTLLTGQLVKAILVLQLGESR